MKFNEQTRELTAAEDKILQNKNSGDFYSSQMWLGNIDSPDNYQDADEPAPELPDAEYCLNKFFGIQEN